MLFGRTVVHQTRCTLLFIFIFFFFNDTPTTEIYPLSLHDALPIFHCDDQGYDLISALFKKTAIEEMMHIELLADRVLFLKGEVELVAAYEVKKIHNVKEMLELATKMEESSANDYNMWANE